MKILIIKMSPVEGLSSSTLRTTALAKGLLKLGHEVDYLTVPMISSHVIDKSNNVRDLFNIIRAPQNKVYEVIASRTKKNSKKNSLKSISINIIRSIYHKLTLFDYTYKIAREFNIKTLEKLDYDVMISSSDPKTSHILAKRLVKQGIKYNKWIQYWGDPLTNDITNKTIYPKWILRRIELNLLRSADKIVYVSPFTYKQQINDFPKLATKMKWLPVPYIKKKNYNLVSNEIFTIGYYGAYFTKIRNIMPLFNSCKKMKDNVHLDIVGDSDLELKDEENIKIYSRRNVDDFEMKVDLLVCVLNNSGTQIPGKIYHYAATNKPILVLLDGDNIEEMKEYLESFNRYIICINKEEEILSAIKEVMDNPRTYKPCEILEPAFIANRVIND
jgi:glycosyltransferase involved in cell wall biosynthesis